MRGETRDRMRGKRQEMVWEGRDKRWDERGEKQEIRLDTTQSAYRINIVQLLIVPLTL